MKKYLDLKLKKESAIYKSFKGIVFIEGLEIIEKNLNLSSIVYRGSISDIKKRVNQGFPVIVILPGIGDIVQFATIVCGYDDNEKRIITYIPEPDSYGAIPEHTFEEEWSQDDYFTILVFPKDMDEIFKNDLFEFNKSNRIYLETERLKIQGKFQESQNILNSFINNSNPSNSEYKDNTQILCLLAGILNEQNNPACVSIYEKVIKINPKYYLAYRGLGNYYLKSKNLKLSKEYYLKAIEINPKRYGPIYKNLGIVLLELGEENLQRIILKNI